MWVIEVNILGRRYIRHVNSVRDGAEALRLPPRLVPWRQWKQRPPRAAA
jgi:hypothetical protein